MIALVLVSISFAVAIILAFLALYLLAMVFISHPCSSGDYAAGSFLMLFPIVFLLLPTFLAMSKDKTVGYREPTSIVKTNNATSVVFIEPDGSAHHWSYKEVSYWNAPNIVIEETSGKNFWGVKVASTFDVALTNNVILEK